MSSVTSGMQTKRGLCFGAFATEPVAHHFLTNAYMAPFASTPLPRNLLPNISQVSYIEPIFMIASTIGTLYTTECNGEQYGTVCHAAQYGTVLFN
jgi:hypothetical protein